MEVGTLKFTWKIKNFSKTEAKYLCSDVFSLGPYKWKIQAYPKGNKTVDHFSIFLCVANSETLPSGWSQNAVYSLTVINQIDKKSSITKGGTSRKRFDAKGNSWGFCPFIYQKELHDPNKGYLVDDTCIVKAHVIIYEDASVDFHGPSKLEACKENNLAKNTSEEDMDSFFVDLNSVIFPQEVVSSEEEAKEALALIEEAFDMVPSDLNNPGRMSQLKNAFDVLSSLDDTSVLTSEQKAELVSMKDNFIDLSWRAAEAARGKKLFAEKELVKKTLDQKLGRCLKFFEKAKAETVQNEREIAILQEQIVEKTRKKEDSTSMQKQMFEQSKELKAELDVLIKRWPVYEARVKVDEEVEKVVGTEWSKMKQTFLSLKKPFYKL